MRALARQIHPGGDLRTVWEMMKSEAPPWEHVIPMAQRYVDMMSAYSSVSHGHLHPRVVAAAQRQLEKVAVTSRAYYGTTLGPLLEKLSQVTGFARALPMNTGAEAVETAIKCARRWGHRVKGIVDGEQQILVARGNFHGRTSTIIGFSSEPEYRAGFGPLAQGFTPAWRAPLPGHYVAGPFVAGDAGELAVLVTAARRRHGRRP